MYFCRCIAYYCVKCFGAVPIVMSEPGNCNLPNSKPFSAISRVFRPLVLNAFARLRLNLVVSIKTVDSVIRSPLPPHYTHPSGLVENRLFRFWPCAFERARQLCFRDIAIFRHSTDPIPIIENRTFSPATR